MAKFDIRWSDMRELSTTIEAESMEEAKRKWDQGEYDPSKIEVADQDICYNGVIGSPECPWEIEEITE